MGYFNRRRLLKSLDARTMIHYKDWKKSNRWYKRTWRRWARWFVPT